MKIKQTLKMILYIFVGTGLFAISVKCVYDPSGMVVGGFSGIAILVKELTKHVTEGGIALGVTTFALNIPLFLVALPMKGRTFILKTGFATGLLSLWLMLLPQVQTIEKDFVLAALFGGVLCGVGIGLVLSTGATTGGTDMLASVLQKFFPLYSTPQIMFVLDGLIILAGAFLFGFPSALYAVASVYVTTKLSDAIVVGAGYAKSVYIISDTPSKVADAVFREINRGITGLHGSGMYTKTEKTVLFCIVSKKQIVRLKQCVFATDPNAFVIVSEVQEVHGEGFYHVEQKSIG